MKKVAYIFFLAVALCLSGCEKITTGGIYGSILLKGAKEKRVEGVMVEIRHDKDDPLVVCSTRSEANGRYEINDLAEGKYYLLATGNQLYPWETTFEIKAGEQLLRDIDMEQKSASFTILVNGIESSTLNFGNDSPQIAFDIFNNSSSDTLRWEAHKGADWIDGIIPSSGRIPGGDQQTVIVSIDRNKLPNPSKNTSTIAVSAPTGGGSKNLDVVAYPEGVDPFPIIESGGSTFAVQLSDITSGSTWSSANALCQESTIGGYTDWRLPTLDELRLIYNNRYKIEELAQNAYWSVTPHTNGYYYIVSMSAGFVYYDHNSYKLCARCVRTVD
jgi:hypothetical protein